MDDDETEDMIEAIAGYTAALASTRIALCVIAGIMWGWYWGIVVLLACIISTKFLTAGIKRNLSNKLVKWRTINDVTK